MRSKLFLANKIQRSIKIEGRSFTFIRYGLDEYKQRSNVPVANIEVKGIYHTTNVYIKESKREGARTKTKQQSLILMSYADGLQLQQDDVVQIEAGTYRVVEMNDVNNFGVAWDVSLERCNGYIQS